LAPGIIKAALGFLARLGGLIAVIPTIVSIAAEPTRRGGVPSMKPIPIILSPTRNRALNMFLGLVLSLVSVLLLLALASYHPSDSSLNTASGADPAHAIQNWIGLFGAYLSDGLLQAFGITVFLFPL